MAPGLLPPASKAVTVDQTLLHSVTLTSSAAVLLGDLCDDTGPTLIIRDTLPILKSAVCHYMPCHVPMTYLKLLGIKTWGPLFSLPHAARELIFMLEDEADD